MTVTKKVGALLVLLTAGSLVGTLAFAWFLLSTAGDGLFLVATTNAQVLIERVYSQTIVVAQEDNPAARQTLQTLTHELDGLIEAMALGGANVRNRPAFSPFGLIHFVNTLGRAGRAPFDMTEDLKRELPVPSGALAGDTAELLQVWRKVSGPFAAAAGLPGGGPENSATYRQVQASHDALAHDALAVAVRRVAVTVGSRLVDQRGSMLVTLGVIAVISVSLFLGGLWFTKRQIAKPIGAIERASAQARRGDFSHTIPIPPRANDEIASLARTFNAMSAEIGRLLERDRELFENAADFLYTINLHGRFLSVNRAGERISGYSREELLSMRFEDLLGPEQEELVHEMRARKISGERVTTVYDVELVTKNARRVFMETHTRLVFDENRPVAIQGVGRDITERKRLQEQLWTAQKMDVLGRLAGGIAHDFGNILTIIMGYCTLLAGSLDPASREHGEVAGIQKAAERAAALIRHLLGFSGGQVFRPRVIGIGPTLTEMTDMLRRLIGEDILVITDIQPGLGAVRFDPNQLEQVIVNLALNARDAMPNGGTLTISAASEESPPSVRIVVSDTGCGMPPEVVERVFEPFYTTKRHGTGLGLSTAHAILRQTGSAISVESVVGKGTTFSIRIPRSISAHHTEPALIEEAPRPIQAAGGIILLVEDETDVRRLVREMLKTYGYNIVEASNQAHAMEICADRDQRIDAILTDVVMPNMSGPELVKRVLPARPRMKVIYMSGHPRDRFISAGVDTDTAHFIQKPVTPESLAAKLRDALGAPSRGETGSIALG